MNWEDASTFAKDEINLIDFLPSNIKINDWIDNFCKAFNLILTNEDEKIFSLDIKNGRLATRVSNIIDLDKKANVYRRTNQPLDLPYVYDLGFTIDKNEAGYVLTQQTGGGQFYTGAFPSDGTIEQTSNFSYNWYKEITYAFDNSVLNVPIITDAEIWENIYDYEEMMNKIYFDKAQRFWYKDYVKNLVLNPDNSIDVAFVKDNINMSILDYENKQNSILRNFFLLLTNSKNYTIVECFLSPNEYNNLPNSLIKFNGDLYHSAEIDGYDPAFKNTGKLKLIKRIV